MQVLQRIIGHDSLFADAQILWGQTRVVLYETERDTSPQLLEQAHESLQRGMGMGAAGSGVYTLWGMIDYYNGRYQEAIERLSRAVEVAPSDAEAQRRLALALLRVGKTDRALDAARHAVQYDPRNPHSYALLGNLSLLIGNAQTALQALQMEDSLRPADQRHRSDTYVAALVASDRREQALDVMKQRLMIEPDSIAALYNLGRMYQLAGKSKRMWDDVLGRARTLVLQQLKAHPQESRLYSYLSLIETRLGNFKEGMNARARALALAPDNYETLYYAARVAALQGGQSPEAYALLAKAIYRRFSLQQILDLDLLALRSDQEFVRKITQ
jgi:tetratricopeptide (TPR) repeat protein